MKKSFSNIQTIIVRCPNWVGDIVMATPTLDCLREGFPQARIVGVLKRSAQGIVRDGPWFDGFVDCEDKSWGGFWRTVKQIRKWKSDMAILLPNSVRSALTVWMGGVKEIYGYRRNLRGIFLSGGPKAIRNCGKVLPIPTTEYYLEICRWLGLNVPQQAKPRLFIREGLLKKAKLLIQKYGIEDTDIVIGLNPGASFGPSKRWPHEYFAEVAELCEKELRARILLFAGPGEEDIAQAILGETRANIIDTSQDKVDLELLKPLIQRCNLFITNDTGPRHYAVAFDVPAVVMMGPIDLRMTGANLDRTIVIRKELACSPCHRRICPKEHQCMREIAPAEVFAAGKKLLEKHK